MVIGQRGHSKWDRFSGLIGHVKITSGVVYGKTTSDAAERANAERVRAKSREEFQDLLKPEDPRWEKRHPFMLFTWDELSALKATLSTL